MAFCAHLCIKRQETLEETFPVTQYPHLKIRRIIPVSLIVSKMHKELNIVTLTGYYSGTSHRSKQAQNPLTLQHCHNTLNICFKIPALLSQHNEEYLKFFRGNLSKSKHLIIKGGKDREYYCFFQQPH